MALKQSCDQLMLRNYYYQSAQNAAAGLWPPPPPALPPDGIGHSFIKQEFNRDQQPPHHYEQQQQQQLQAAAHEKNRQRLSYEDKAAAVAENKAKYNRSCGADRGRWQNDAVDNGGGAADRRLSALAAAVTNNSKYGVNQKHNLPGAMTSSNGNNGQWL